MAYIQSANIRNATGTAVKAFTTNVTAGSLLIVSVMFEDITTSVSTITDSQSNTYQQAGTIVRTTTALGLQVYYAYNANAGATTVTAVASASTPITISIHEYSGMMTAGNPFDTTVSAFNNSNDSPASGSLTTAVASELLFAVAANNRSTVTAGSGYTVRETAALNWWMVSEDQTAGAAGSYSATTGVMTLAGQWAMRLAAFKPPAAAGGGSRRSLTGAGR